MNADFADMNNIIAACASLTVRLIGRSDDRDTSSEKQKWITVHNGQQYWGNSLVTNWLTDTIFTLSRLR